MREYFHASGKSLKINEIAERLLFVQVLESLRYFQEKVIHSEADANVGSLLGWGFAPFKGGTFQYIFDYGVKNFLEKTKEMSLAYGSRFSPPYMLIEMANKKE